MEEAFEQLDLLIITTIAPGNISKQLLSGEHIHTIQYNIMAACDMLRKYIRHAAFHSISEEGFGLLIHNCQATLVDLLDKLFTYKTVISDPAIIGLYENAETQLEEIFHSIKSRYRESFNDNSRVPLRLQHQYMDSLDEKMPHLRQKIKSILSNTALIDIALQPIQSFRKGIGEDTNNWRFFSYIKELSAQLDEWPRNGDSREDPEWKFIVLLVEMNINHKPAYHYCRDFISGRVQREQDVNKKADLLDKFSRDVQNLIPPSDVAYNPGMMPVKEYMQRCVNTESEAVEKAWFLLQSQKEAAKPGKKMRSRLSNALIGIWVRAEMYAGKILSDKVEDIMATWTELVESKDGRRISAKSLQGKSGPSANIQAWEKNLLIGILERMIKYVQAL